MLAFFFIIFFLVMCIKIQNITWHALMMNLSQACIGKHIHLLSIILSQKMLFFFHLIVTNWNLFKYFIHVHHIGSQKFEFVDPILRYKLCTQYAYTNLNCHIQPPQILLYMLSFNFNRISLSLLGCKHFGIF